jgi:general stress protein CsbA
VTKNAVIAIKLGSIAFNLCLCSALFVLVSAITRSRWLGVLGAGIVGLSGMHLYMIAEFIKNLAGMSLLQNSQLR